MDPLTLTQNPIVLLVLVAVVAIAPKLLPSVLPLLRRLGGMIPQEPAAKAQEALTTEQSALMVLKALARKRYFWCKTPEESIQRYAADALQRHDQEEDQKLKESLIKSTPAASDAVKPSA